MFARRVLTLSLLCLEIEYELNRRFETHIRRRFPLSPMLMSREATYR
jgi:hypothetical protein